MKSSTNLIKSSQDMVLSDSWLPSELALSVLKGKGSSQMNPAEEAALQDIQEKAHHLAQQAYEEGLTAANVEIGERLATARAILEEIMSWRENAFLTCEADMVALVLAICKTLFGNGFEIEPELLQNLISRAIHVAKPLGDIRIHLNPSDIDQLDPAWTDEMTSLSNNDIEWIPDEAIRPGGCLVQGASGTIDARVETRVALIEKELLKALEVGEGDHS
jgi:flagellar assembly protein FliH